MFYAARGRSVMVTDAVARDNDGNPITGSTPRQVDGIVIEQQTTSTNTSEHGQLAQSSCRMLFPEDDPITLGAKVQLLVEQDGELVAEPGVWHVVGKPQRAQSQQTGWCPGRIVEFVQIGSKAAS